VTAAPTALPQGRDPLWDIAKMTLVTLVVVGHSLLLLPQTATVHHLYHFVYVFHIPAFVLVTGYLSRSFAWTRRRLWSLVRTLLVPYLLFELLLTSYRHLIAGTSLHNLWIAPHWPMWYLLATLVWRLVTPVFKAMGAWAVPVAVAVSLLGGYVDWPYLSTGRILGMLPFFVIGLVLTPGAFERFRAPAVRWAGAAVIVLTFVGLDLLPRASWFYFKYPYAALTSHEGTAWLVRLWLIVVSLVVAMSVLAVLPRRTGWYARMGAASLVVYLCHGFVVKTVSALGFPDWAAGHVWPALPMVLLGAVGLALLLASPPVSRVLENLVDPIGGWQALRARLRNR
jgi:fucose 4-O-acetylase-like acetyltransferase